VNSDDVDYLAPPKQNPEWSRVLTIDAALELLPNATLVTGEASSTFASVEVDSRLIQPGALFCCIPGSQSDGHDFAQSAVAAGAVGVLSERPVPSGAEFEIRVPIGAARYATALLSAAVCGYPARELTIAGITGTNGKTTTAHLMATIASYAGRHGVMIGTLTGARTTPAAPELQRELLRIQQEASLEGRHGLVALEVSSHALDQHRVDGMVFDVAVFTNLTQDHLDYHGTMEAYFEAKSRLFDPMVARQAVIWIESEAGRRLVASRQAPSIEVGWHSVEGLTSGVSETNFRWRGFNVTTKLISRPTIIDLVLAGEACVALGISAAEAAKAMAVLTPAPGRMQQLRSSQNDPLVIVDYAHTPDALEELLAYLRGALDPEGQLRVVFGCGGERDRDKRPIMGAIAARLADHVTVTSDNSRSEDTTDIIAEITAGISGPVITIEDRASAIRAAISEAGSHDIVVIAGKGHETAQEIDGRTISFNDALFAQAVLDETMGDR